MKCLNCKSENPDNHKFCSQCGAKLEKVCPKCKEICSAEYRFCGQCGYDLTVSVEPVPKELSFDEKLNKIQRYLPRGLTEKILSQRDRIEGERRYVTIMFCDMEGFTRLVEKAGPEAAYGIMDRIYEILIHKVHDYEGTVNEMTGDGVMALFGAPIALEDAPERAVRASLAIHREMKRFNDDEKALGEVSVIRMRIGLHSGPVVVGTLGNDLRVEFKAVGDTVNLASRMEGLAEPGTTCVTHEIFSRTQGIFRFEALGEKEIKGKEERVKVYRVVGPSAKKTRFDVSAERGLTPLKGREKELELLHECFGRVREGKGQAVSIVAEAGVGKSRLLYEFRKRMANEDMAILEGQCVSYGANTPYIPIIDVLKDNFQIVGEVDPEEMRERVTSGLRQMDADLDQHLPFFLDLLALENGGQFLKDLDPETKRRKTFEALIALTLRGAQRRPLVMVIEDLHWIDKTSEEAIGRLLDRIGGVRVLMVFTFRPTYVPPWGGKSYYSQIHLNRLSKRESLGMIQSILNVQSLDKTLTEDLLTKTEGIPLFAEEFAHSLKEAGVVQDEVGRVCLKSDKSSVGIPGSIHDVLMARVDRLSESSKEVLRVGSVIGREFSRKLLGEITELSEAELLTGLTELRESEMLLERGFFTDTTYLFHHAMIRELLYSSLLPGRCSEYHRIIGLAMEKLYSDHLEEHASVLALHFTHGKEEEKAYSYHHLAGERAAASYANREALYHFQEAWRLIDENKSESDVKPKRLNTAIKLAEVMEFFGKFEETLVLLKEVLKDFQGTDRPANYDRLYYWMGNTLGNLGRYDEARKQLFRSLDLSKLSENKEVAGDANSYLAQLDYMNGYFKRALVHAEESIQCLEGIVNQGRMAWAVAIKGMILSYLKGNTDWKQFIEETQPLIDSSGNDRARCFMMITMGRNLLYTGQYESLLNISLSGVEMARKIGDGIQSAALLANAGQGALYLGRVGMALDLLREAEHVAKKIGHPLVLTYARVSLARALLRSGNPEKAAFTAEELLKFTQSLDLGPSLQGTLETNAEILAHRNPKDNAHIDGMMKQASTLLERTHSPWLKIQHLMARARIGLRLGRLECAQKDLEEARCLYRQLGVESGTRELWILKRHSKKQRWRGGNNMRLMAVMAHPDDAEIWCGGTLSLHVEKGDEVRICTLSYRGDSIRGREAREGAKRMGCEVECLGFEDTRVRDTDSTVESLKKSLESFDPDFIITHWFDDMHPDHEAVFLILRRTLVSNFLDKPLETLKPAPQVFSCDTYSSLGIHGPFEPHQRVDVTGMWERKMEAIHAHESQPLEFYLNMIKLQCRVHGKAAGTTFAEAFIRVPLFGNLDEIVKLG